MGRPASGAGRGIGLKPMPQMERREAQRPTSLGARASQRRAWVTGLCRRRVKRVLARAVGGLASPWRLPALHSLGFAEGRKKGKGRRPRPQTRAAKRWLFLKIESEMRDAPAATSTVRDRNSRRKARRSRASVPGPSRAARRSGGHRSGPPPGRYRKASAG